MSEIFFQNVCLADLESVIADLTLLSKDYDQSDDTKDHKCDNSANDFKSVRKTFAGAT